MYDVVLVNCECRLVSERYEHLGMGHLKSYLQAQGTKVDIIDGHFHELDPEVIANEVLSRNPSLVGFSVFFNNQDPTMKTAQILRKRGFTGHICAGGHHASFRHAALLDECSALDSVVMGEGELTLTDLMGTLKSGHAWEDVPGLAYCDNSNRVQVTRPRDLIRDIDSLPFPDRSSYMKRLQAGGIANMASSRGCYASCSFCSVSAFYLLGKGPGHGWRPRSPRNVVDEMEALAQVGARHIHFVDDNFIGSGKRGRDRAKAIGQELIDRKLGLSFDLDCRACDVDEETLEFLMAAGLNHIGSGIESMISRQLELFQKRVDVDQNLQAIEILNRLGLNYHLYFVAIEPFVTVEELLETLDWMEEIGLEHILDGQILSWLVVLEGTSIHDRLRDENVLWSGASETEHSEFPWGRPYVVRDKRVGAALPFLHRLHWRYLELQQNYLESMRADNSLIRILVDDIAEALKRHKLRLIRDLLTASKAEELNSVSSNLEARLEKLEKDVQRIHGDWQRAHFDRLEPREVQIGEETIPYPPPLVSNLLSQVQKCLG